MVGKVHPCSPDLPIRQCHLCQIPLVKRGVALQPVQFCEGGIIHQVQLSVNGRHWIVPIDHRQATHVQGLGLHRDRLNHEGGTRQLAMIGPATFQRAVDEDWDGVHLG